MKYSLVMSAVLAALTNTALAESESIGDEQLQDMEVITVSGEKIERTLQETTSSVTVFDGNTLEDSTKIDDLFDLLDQTPNAASFGTYDYTIRGVTTGGQSFQPISSTIGVFIDGVAATTRSAQRGALSTWDLEQVEVIKGPQSTNQGRNSLAGAIVLRSRDPEFDANGKFRASYGEFGTSQLAIMQTGAITDDLAFRVTADQRKTDGFVENPVLGLDDFDRDEITTLRGKLLKTFESGAEVILSLSQTEIDDFGVDNVSNFDPINQRLIDPTQRLNFDNYFSTWKTDAVSHSLKIYVPLNDYWDVTALSSYADEDFRRDSDIDGFDGDATLDLFDQETQFNQEVRFTYEGDDLTANIGLYYGEGEYDADWRTQSLEVPLGGPIVPVVNIDILQKEEFRNMAIFANADYKLTENLKLLAGLRVDDDERTGFINNDVDVLNDLTPFDPFCVDLLGGPCNAAVAMLIGSGGNGDSSLTEVLPKIGFDYQAAENINVGLVFTQGYRPGGTSINPVRASVTAFDAEYTSNYELSFRSNWMENRLIVNANAFFTDWEDQQISVDGAFGPYDSDVRNAGESHIQGLELEAFYVINDEFKLNASLGLLESEFDEFENPNGNDLTGNEFQGAPDVTANLNLNWDSGEGYFASLNINHVGEQFQNANNEVLLDAVTLVNANAGYKADSWSLVVFANNLFDEEHIVEQYNMGTTPDGDDILSLVYADPQLFGARLQYAW